MKLIYLRLMDCWDLLTSQIIGFCNCIYMLLAVKKFENRPLLLDCFGIPDIVKLV